MNIKSKTGKEFFTDGLLRRSRIIIGIMLSVTLILPVVFFVGTMMETMSYGKAILGDDRYNARISDSYIYTLVLFGFALMIVTPVIFFVKKMTNNYLQSINSLSETDMEKLLKVNNMAPFYEKFMPSYIIKEGTVCFFYLFQHTTIFFKDIVAINVKHSYYKGYTASVYIQTIAKTYRFRLIGNVFIVKNLTDEAVKINPEIILNKDWNIG